MYIQQSDLLRGLGKDFVKTVMDLAHKEDHKRGFVLFREGDRAQSLFHSAERPCEHHPW